MAFSYNKLWKILIDENMKKSDLRELTGLSPNTMARLSKGESVKMDVIGRICEQLNCTVGDIVDFVPNIEENDDNQDG